jgi:hypothetical protein
MAVTEAAEIKKVTAAVTDQTIDFVNNIKELYIRTSGDAYIAFDRAATTNDFLIQSTDGIIELEVHCTQVHVISSGTPTVYVIGIR